MQSETKIDSSNSLTNFWRCSIQRVLCHGSSIITSLRCLGLYHTYAASKMLLLHAHTVRHYLAHLSLSSKLSQPIATTVIRESKSHTACSINRILVSQRRVLLNKTRTHNSTVCSKTKLIRQALSAQELTVDETLNAFYLAILLL